MRQSYPMCQSVLNMLLLSLFCTKGTKNQLLQFHPFHISKNQTETPTNSFPAANYNYYKYYNVLQCTTMYYYVLLCTTMCYYVLLCTSIYYYLLLSTTIYYYLLTTIYLLLSTTIYYLLSTIYYLLSTIYYYYYYYNYNDHHHHRYYYFFHYCFYLKIAHKAPLERPRSFLFGVIPLFVEARCVAAPYRAAHRPSVEGQWANDTCSAGEYR